MASETLQQQLENAVTRLKSDSDLLHQVVHGLATETVAVESGEIKTLAKAIADLQATINGLTYGANGIGLGNPAEVKNVLHVRGNSVGDGDNDYGITIEALEPALTLIDANAGGGSLQLRAQPDGSLALYRDTTNDSTIGHASNTTTRLAASITPDGAVFYDASQSEVARLASSGTILPNDLACASARFTRIVIGNDSVATITPPMTGGFLLLSLTGPAYPQIRNSALLWFDVGLSPFLQLIVTPTPFASAVETSLEAITGTSAQEGNLMIAAHNNQLHLNNRYGSAQMFALSFL